MDVSGLHICSDRTASKANSDAMCEDFFRDDFCEGGYERRHSMSTLISWQHFPRSTSSRCDISTLEISKSISVTPPLASVEEEPKLTPVSSDEYPITKTNSQLQALHYLKIRHVYDFLNFLIGHLVCNEPEEPVEFLEELLNKCLRYRDSFGDPPCLFTYSHIRSLYRAFDPFERGYITLEQYKEAMRSLGLKDNITPYNETPQLNEDGYVEESEFVFEAGRCMMENLKEMLRIPKMWEENRRLWNKKMANAELKNFKKTENEVETGSEKKEDEDEEEEDQFRKRSQKKFNNEIPCPTWSYVKQEPEQLFLSCSSLEK